MSADVSQILPLPPTPANCDLRHLPAMLINIVRLQGSSFDAMGDDSAWRAGINLWFSSWHQVPAASLPNDDEELTKLAGLGRDHRTWRRIKAKALHGWYRCSDGKLYHRVVAETALESWLEALGRQLSSGAGNAKRWNVPFDPAPLKAEIAMAAEMLAKLNPKSTALAKPHVKSATEQEPIPAGDNRHPAGIDPASRRRPRSVQDQSEYNRIEKDNPPNPPLAGWTVSSRSIFARAHALFPAEGRAACSVDEAWAAWGAEVSSGVKPESLLAAVQSFAVVCKDGARVMAMHRWLRLKRYQSLLPMTDKSSWPGPDHVRAAVAAEKGADYCLAWLENGNGWRDLPTPAIVCRTETAARHLRRDVGRVLADLGVEIVHEKAV